MSRMAAILPWQPNETCHEVIRHLAAGRCVALPTESGYEIAVSALHPVPWADLPANQVAAIAVLDYADLFDWLPRLKGAGARLFRKLGPGPFALRADGGYREGLWSRLPVVVQQRVARDGMITLRWPAHPIWSELRGAGIPLASISVENAVTATEVAQGVDETVACVVDGGTPEFPGSPTIVRSEGRCCIVERAGVLTQAQIDELATCRILFICTGNTCRSPLAEGLCARLLAEHYGCSVGELNRQGFFVQSAGVAAMMGGGASPDAVAVAADQGADLSQHRSRMVTMDMLLLADHVFGMTAGHCYTLESVLMEGMTRPRPLSPSYEDIVDPIGGALADYRTCASQILACLQARLPELVES